MSVRTLEELQSALADAQIELETVDATLLGLDPLKADKRDVEELEARFAQKEAELAKIADDIDRKERMGEALKRVPKPDTSGVEVGREPRTYERGIRNPDGKVRSFFQDLFHAKGDDHEAQARLARHAREVAVEQRAAISTSSGGPGLVPPQYLLDDLARFARSSRPFADALGPRALPDAGMTFNVPRVTTGTLAAKKTEGSAVQVGSTVTDYLSFSVNTVAGLQDVSRELLDRSDPATDQVLGQDLAADYAKKLDTELLNQTTNGITLLSGTNAITYTQASPTAITLYPKFAAAISAVWTNRFAAPDLIVMHPRRWAQLLGGTDSTGRPLVLPDTVAGTQAFNLMSTGDGSVPSGLVGQIQGLPVVVDPNIVTNLGAGTNQDTIIVTRRADQLFFEVGAPTVSVETGVLSGNLQVRIYAWGYFAFTFARYATSTSIIDGTGLITPTFA
jgi:HK97 family phage major capsid protein